MLNYFKNKYKINKFARSISLKSNLAKFKDLYQDIDGYKTANQNSEVLNNSTQVYGEIDFFSFAALLSLVNPKPNDIFLDLGSGVAKPCITAALVFNIQSCSGIEISPSLHAKAMQVYTKCSLELKKQLTFINNDFYNQKINDASIIFINATAFFGEQWQKLEQYLIDNVPSNCHLLICSKKINHNHFKLLHCKATQMNYGQSHVYIYQRCL